MHVHWFPEMRRGLEAYPASIPCKPVSLRHSCGDEQSGMQPRRPMQSPVSVKKRACIAYSHRRESDAAPQPAAYDTTADHGRMTASPPTVPCLLPGDTLEIKAFRAAIHPSLPLFIATNHVRILHTMPCRSGGGSRDGGVRNRFGTHPIPPQHAPLTPTVSLGVSAMHATCP